MNNKKGGFGAKLLLVLILMIASAVGGAYGYRVLDGKMAVSDAKKAVDNVRVSDYDTTEAVQIETYKEEAGKSLETAATRKEVYEILEDFNENVDKVMTKTEKELEEARKAASEAAQNANNNNSDNNSSNIWGIGSQNDSQNDDSSTSADQEQDQKSSGSLLGNLLGGGSDDSADDDTANEDNDPFN